MFEEEKEKRRRRLNDVARMRSKAQRIARLMFADLRGQKREEIIENFVRTHANNLAKCSCSMCCNRRRSPYSKGSLRLTMQERRRARGDDE